MKNKIKIFISVLFFIVFIFTLAIGSYQQNIKYSKQTEITSQIKALEQEKASTLKDIADLKKDYNAKRNDKTRYEFIFNKPSKEVYNNYFPVMSQNKIKGVIAFSPKDLFEENGNMTEAQFREMINSGWTYAVMWDGKGSFESFMASVRETFSKNHMRMSKIILFATGTYSKKYDKVLEKYKLDAVIHHGEEESDIVIPDYNTKFLKLGAFNLSDKKLTQYLNKAVENKGNILLEINLNAEEKSFNNEKIKSMFDEILMYSKEENIDITTLSEVILNTKKLSEKDTALNKEYLKEKTKLEKHIEEIDNQIKSLCYGQGK